MAEENSCPAPDSDSDRLPKLCSRYFASLSSHECDRLMARVADEPGFERRLFEHLNDLSRAAMSCEYDSDAEFFGRQRAFLSPVRSRDLDFAQVARFVLGVEARVRFDKLALGDSETDARARVRARALLSLAEPNISGERG